MRKIGLDMIVSLKADNNLPMFKFQWGGPKLRIVNQGAWVSSFDGAFDAE